MPKTTHSKFAGLANNSVISSSSGASCTYYPATDATYLKSDDKGDLRFVLQQMYQMTPDLELYAFQYKYDGHGNCIWKKLPGAEYIEYVYDGYDRLAYSQDGNQRTSDKWTYYWYDVMSRLTNQGECTGKNSNSNQDSISQTLTIAIIY